MPPGYPDLVALDRLWAMVVQNSLASVVPCAGHGHRQNERHYIHTAQPELVIDEVRRVLRMVRPMPVRCQGGAESCTAGVNLAGGASHKPVVIERSDTGLRLVSAWPNRRLEPEQTEVVQRESCVPGAAIPRRRRRSMPVRYPVPLGR